MKLTSKSRMVVRILCLVLAGLMVLGGASYLLYALL